MVREGSGTKRQGELTIKVDLFALASALKDVFLILKISFYPHYFFLFRVCFLDIHRLSHC